LLLPDITHDTVNKDIEKYGIFLCQLFDTWLEHNDKNICLRYCQSIVNLLLGKSALSQHLAKNQLPEEETDENDVHHHQQESVPNNEPISMKPVTPKDLEHKNPFLKSVGDHLEYEVLDDRFTKSI
jgi:hypothetical protein